VLLYLLGSVWSAEGVRVSSIAVVVYLHEFVAVAPQMPPASWPRFNIDLSSHLLIYCHIQDHWDKKIKLVHNVAVQNESTHTHQVNMLMLLHTHTPSRHVNVTPHTHTHTPSRHVNVTQTCGGVLKRRPGLLIARRPNQQAWYKQTDSKTVTVKITVIDCLQLSDTETFSEQKSLLKT